MVEHLAKIGGINMKILSCQKTVQTYHLEMGDPWSSYAYTYHRLSTSLQQKLWYAFRWPRAEAYWPEADVVYCTAESYVPTSEASLVATLHDASFFEAEGTAHRGVRLQAAKWTLLYRRLSQTADLFHTVSNFSAERIAHYFPSIKNRLRVIHSGVSHRFFEPVPEQGKAQVEEMGLANQTFILVPVGLHYRKGAELILKAWPRLKSDNEDVRLVVVSHNDHDYRDLLKELDSSVVITGFVSDTTLHALYTSARAVWYPSRYEGFGLPVLEAMACGTPIVASDTSALPEVGGDAALLVPFDQEEKHVEALDALIHNDELYSCHRKRGRKRARKFTWQRAANELYKCFEEVA